MPGGSISTFHSKIISYFTTDWGFLLVRMPKLTSKAVILPWILNLQIQFHSFLFSDKK